MLGVKVKKFEMNTENDDGNTAGKLRLKLQLKFLMLDKK